MEDRDAIEAYEAIAARVGSLTTRLRLLPDKRFSSVMIFFADGTWVAHAGIGWSTGQHFHPTRALDEVEHYIAQSEALARTLGVEVA